MDDDKYLSVLRAEGSSDKVLEAYQKMRDQFAGNQHGSIADWAILRYCGGDEDVRDKFLDLGKSAGFLEIKPVLWFENDIFGDGNLDWDRKTINPEEVDDYRISENQVVHPDKGVPVEGKLAYEPFLTTEWLDYQTSQTLSESARSAIVAAAKVLAGVESVDSTPAEVRRTLRGMISTVDRILEKY